MRARPNSSQVETGVSSSPVVRGLMPRCRRYTGGAEQNDDATDEFVHVQVLQD